jgi:hypothetical protein
MNGNKYTVMLLFVATSATAPVAGVAFGGWVIDRCAGGFRGANRPKALRLVLLLGVLANFAGWVGGWYESKSIYFVVGCIWLLLFFGAACLPPLTGMYMDAVSDKRLKVRTGQSEGEEWHEGAERGQRAVNAWDKACSARVGYSIVCDGRVLGLGKQQCRAAGCVVCVCCVVCVSCVERGTQERTLNAECVVNSFS